MQKIVLIDGNNLLFRSYYATAYNGNTMRNSKGFPTNGLYGFINMLNKIINEEQPVYVMVAFDKGKTFRHEKYTDYKAGRNATPEELKLQFPVAKQIVEALGMTYCEIDNYEADDIIGTYVKAAECDDDFYSVLVALLCADNVVATNALIACTAVADKRIVFVKRYAFACFVARCFKTKAHCVWWRRTFFNALNCAVDILNNFVFAHNHNYLTGAKNYAGNSV